MINRVILVGRLTKDPELRYTPSGVAVATFNLAVNRPYKNQAGENEADFISIVAWRQLAELCANYLKKGSQTALEGRLQTRSYENKEGKKVYVTEVVADNVQFLSPKKDENGAGGNPSRSGQGGRDPFDFGGGGYPMDITDDDLPF
jgi:single-strand DNA-binding protein